MSRRSWPVVLGAALLGITVAGCSLFGDPEAEAAQEARNQAEVAAIRDRLASMPGVLEVHVGWADNLTNSAQAHADLRVTDGSELGHFADLAVKEIWQSKIEPVRYIRVGVVSGADGRPGITRSYIVAERKAELEAEFGPRPVPEDG